jgi:cysteine desulfurase
LTVYLDCNATTPIEPEVADLVMYYMREEYGNAGSRTHEFGLKAKRAVEEARGRVAQVIGAEKSEIIFTSGATESNNIAILGLAKAAEAQGRRHIISSPLEHKAVLEPLEQLALRGFEIELLPADERGWINPADLANSLRPDTFLVSLMHVNNETGVLQPVEGYVDVLEGHAAFLHIDAAQGFGKDMDSICFPRIDLLSISGHKIHGPKGIGALVARRRGFDQLPLTPLVFGGGQERGLRPGTLAVPLVAGIGLAAYASARDHAARVERLQEHLQHALGSLLPLGAVINGDRDQLLGNAINVSLPGIDSEAVMLAMKGAAAISNGSACTSSDYSPSHVLAGMNLDPSRIQAAIRISWSHLTPPVDWSILASAVHRLSPVEAPAT